MTDRPADAVGRMGYWALAGFIHLLSAAIAVLGYASGYEYIGALGLMSLVIVSIVNALEWLKEANGDRNV
jgi:hypothetical protein